MSLQLAENRWLLKLEKTLKADIYNHFLGVFSNPFVIIKVTSDTAHPVWRKGGEIGQAIPFRDSLAYGEVKEITLKTYFLLQFPLLSGESYNLYYFPLPHLIEVELEIWEYQGETIDNSIKQIAKAVEQADFSKLEKTITPVPQTGQRLEAEESTEKDNNYPPGIIDP